MEQEFELAIYASANPLISCTTRCENTFLKIIINSSGFILYFHLNISCPNMFSSSQLPELAYQHRRKRIFESEIVRLHKNAVQKSIKNQIR